MFDLLSTNESAHAAAHGWLLSWVYDGRIGKSFVEILASGSSPAVKHAEAARNHVVAQARMGDPTAIKALRLTVQSRQGDPKKGKKK